ncbi:MAG: TolC family protein [Elusimicrobiales bacterium]|nr:TolC family protein [Elusimicrobiales bacterium]
MKTNSRILQILKPLSAILIAAFFAVSPSHAEDGTIPGLAATENSAVNTDSAADKNASAADGNYIPKITLEDYRKNAVNNNHEIREMEYLRLAAAETKKMAFTKYFPQAAIGAFAGDTNIIHGMLSLNGLGKDLTEPFTDSNVGGTMAIAAAVQPLYMGRRIVNGNKLAAIGEAAALQQLLMKKQEVSLEAEKKYRLVQLLEKKMGTVIAYEKLLDSLHSMVSQALENGLCSKTDFLRVKLKKEEVAVKKEQLRKLTALAKREMKVYAGMPPEEDFALLYGEETPQNPDYDINSLKEKVLERPEHKLLVMNAQAAELQKKMKCGEYMPQAIAGAAIYSESIFIDNHFSKSDAHYNDTAVFAAITMPISGWWEASHTVKDLKYKEDAAKKKLQDLDKYLLLDLENKLTSLETAYGEVKVAEIGLEMSKANRIEQEDGYKNGTITLADYLKALAEEHNDSDNLEEAKNKYFQAKTDFLNAAGE